MVMKLLLKSEMGGISVGFLPPSHKFLKGLPILACHLGKRFGLEKWFLELGGGHKLPDPDLANQPGCWGKDKQQHQDWYFHKDSGWGTLILFPQHFGVYWMLYNFILLCCLL